MDASICPLCQGPNHCGAEQGKSTCWCFYTHIPEDVLARIPDEYRGQVCICERCATAGRDASPNDESGTSRRSRENQ